ncbi:MAG: tyrosine-type recombinase/integrase [Rubrobacteraceae bacterium]
MALSQFASVVGGRGKSLGQITHEDLAAYQKELLAHRYRRSPKGAWKPLAATTRYERQAVVCRFFDWLVSQRVLLADPAAKAWPRWNGRPLPRRALCEKEIERLLAAPDPKSPFGLRDRAILELFYSSGLRLGELAALDLTDIDLSGGTVLVRAGKGAKSRVVPLGETAGKALALYLRDARPCLAKNPGVNALFLGGRGVGKGRRLVACSIGERVSMAADKAGLLGVTPHRLRHSVATHLLRAGADIRHVQEILGHAHVQTTEIYTHLAIPDLLEAHQRTHPRGHLARLARTALERPKPTP